jgi:hypothetical protein
MRKMEIRQDQPLDGVESAPGSGRRFHRLVAMLISLLSLYSCFTLLAQDTGHDAWFKLWSVSADLGFCRGGPYREVEEAMREYDFDVSTFSWWSGDIISHPFSNPGGFAWGVHARRYFDENLALGVYAGNSHCGTTHGYHAQAHYLFVEYSVISVETTVSVNYYDFLHLGAGPALYLVRSWRSSENADTGAEEYMHPKAGFVFELGVRIPRRSRFFLDLSFQCHCTGKAEIGPFTAQYVSYYVTLPAMDVPFNHLGFLIGTGIRL